jgi:hypothetical protein
MGFFVQDFQPLVTSAACPEINIINTIDEYVAEVLLNHKNAVPESNDHTKKDLQVHKHVVTKLITFPAIPVTFHHDSNPPSKACIFCENYHYRFSRDINPPPPKPVC